LSLRLRLRSQVYPSKILKIHPLLPAQAYTVRVDPYTHSLHIKVLKHFIYIIWMWIVLYRGFEPQPWHYIIPQAQVYPKIVPKIHPQPPQAYTVRVDPYAHQQHVKVLKNYAYIAYGCGIHSTVCLSLNHGIASSLGHRSTHTPNLHWCNTVRVDPYAHPQHFKVLKHFAYICNDCEM
jgi:hypothetical protein